MEALNFFYGNFSDLIDELVIRNSEKETIVWSIARKELVWFSWTCIW